MSILWQSLVIYCFHGFLFPVHACATCLTNLSFDMFCNLCQKVRARTAVATCKGVMPNSSCKHANVAFGLQCIMLVTLPICHESNCLLSARVVHQTSAAYVATGHTAPIRAKRRIC